MLNEQDEHKEEDEEEDETETVDDESYKKIGHNVVSDRSERRISGLRQDNDLGDLVINPIWQRLHVWDDTKASRLIESILLNIPIPMIYVADEGGTEGKELVIDGQQRLRSAFRYINNEYSLRGLKVFVGLNGKKFSDLDKDYQRKINRYNFTVVRIQEALSDEKVKFDIFERINTGAVNLNPQELRNCLYVGDYNEFLKEIADDPLFKKLYFGQNKPQRMQDVEMVLRFFSFSIEGLHSYTGRLKSFLNNHINKYTKLFENFNDSEKKKEQKKLREMFQKSITLANSAFEKPFRSCQLRDDKTLTWNRSPNKSLYDAVMYGFIHFEKNQVMNHLDSINEALINIILNDPAFLPSSQTVSKKNVNYRFNRWRKELDEIITSPIQPRTFSRKLKQELFDIDSTCKICKQAILSIDDSEIDHIKPYWKGGATIPENAQLVHRFCNRSKSGK